MKKRRSKKGTGADLIARSILADKRAKELRINITPSERRVKKLLDILELEYTFQYPIYDEWFFIIADFYLHNERLCIEVDGESHFNKAARAKEAKRKRWLKKDAIQVLRIKNKATIKMTPAQLKNRIEKSVARMSKKKRK